MTGRNTATAEVHDAAGAILEHIGVAVEGPRAYHVIRRDRRSNSVDEVHLADGRILVIKRARDPGNAYRFRTSRIAAALLEGSEGVVTPGYVKLPPALEDEAILVYWWVPGPTLHELWPGVEAADRAETVRDWGRLIRRLQAVRPRGHGPLPDAVRSDTALDGYLETDVGDRLLPAVRAGWPDGVPAAEGLLASIPDLVTAVGARPPVLVHNDLFDQNVLCRVDDGVRCVGVIDFEDAFAGPAEAELAKTEVLHGPLFGQPWAWDWFPHLAEGWGGAPDPLALGYFRAYHLVNMGLHAANTGLDDHAAQVAAVAREEVARLGSGLDHRRVAGRALA